MACNRHLVPAAGLLLLDMVLRPCGGLAQGVLEEVPFDQKLVPGAPAADAFGDGFGVELAIAGDTLVVGASTANVGGKFFVGAADLFLRDPASGAWGAPRRLLAEDGAAFDQLGGAGVAVAGDEVFLGVPLARVDGVLQQGAVYVFARDAGGADAWGQAAKLTDASVGSIGHFGASIALEGDLLAVGASRGGGGNGQVTILERDRGGPGDWGVAGSILDGAVGDGGLPLEDFGGAVALEGDLLLVGASSADVSFFREDDGAAYLFRRDALFPDAVELRDPADGPRRDRLSRRADPGRGVARERGGAGGGRALRARGGADGPRRLRRVGGDRGRHHPRRLARGRGGVGRGGGRGLRLPPRPGRRGRLEPRRAAGAERPRGVERGAASERRWPSTATPSSWARRGPRSARRPTRAPSIASSGTRAGPTPGARRASSWRRTAWPGRTSGRRWPSTARRRSSGRATMSWDMVRSI